MCKRVSFSEYLNTILVFHPDDAALPFDFHSKSDDKQCKTILKTKLRPVVISEPSFLTNHDEDDCYCITWSELVGDQSELDVKNALEHFSNCHQSNECVEVMFQDSNHSEMFVVWNFRWLHKLEFVEQNIIKDLTHMISTKLGQRDFIILPDVSSQHVYVPKNVFRDQFIHGDKNSELDSKTLYFKCSGQMMDRTNVFLFQIKRCSAGFFNLLVLHSFDMTLWIDS